MANSTTVVSSLVYYEAIKTNKITCLSIPENVDLMFVER